jgi:hypothetical protein
MLRTTSFVSKYLEIKCSLTGGKKLYIWVKTTYSEREQNCISEYEGATEVGRKKMWENEKYWNNPSIYEY